MIAEEGDVIDAAKRPRAFGHGGSAKVIRRISPSPGCLSRPEWGFVAHQHPLAGVAAPTPEQLSSIRQLILNTYTGAEAARQGGWSGRHPAICCCWRWRNRVRLGGAAALAGATIRPRQTHPAAAARLAKTDFGGCGLVQLTRRARRGSGCWIACWAIPSLKRRRCVPEWRARRYRAVPACPSSAASLMKASRSSSATSRRGPASVRIADPQRLHRPLAGQRRQLRPVPARDVVITLLRSVDRAPGSCN